MHLHILVLRVIDECASLADFFIYFDVLFQYLSDRMFKTDQSLTATVRRLSKEEGMSFMARGVSSNTTAVAVPIAITIFLTDLLLSMKYSNEKS
jgi:hypothetical protein